MGRDNSPMAEVIGAPYSEHVRPDKCHILAVADDEAVHRMDSNRPLFDRLKQVAKWAEVYGPAEDATLADCAIGTFAMSPDRNLDPLQPAGRSIYEMVRFAQDPVVEDEHTPEIGPRFRMAWDTFDPFRQDGIEMPREAFEALPDVVTREDHFNGPSDIGFGAMAHHREQVALLWADVVIDLTPDAHQLHPDIRRELDADVETDPAEGLDAYDVTVEELKAEYDEQVRVPWNHYLRLSTRHTEGVAFVETTDDPDADGRIVYDTDTPEYDHYRQVWTPDPEEATVAPTRPERHHEARRATTGNRGWEGDPHSADAWKVDPETHPGSHALATRDERTGEPASYDEPGAPDSTVSRWN